METAKPLVDSSTDFIKYWSIAQKEVRRICGRNRKVDEQKAQDVATDLVLKLAGDAEKKTASLWAYVKAAVRQKLQQEASRGRLNYGIGFDSLPVDDDGEYVDIEDSNSRSGIVEMEMWEELDKINLSQEDWELIERAKTKELLSGTERKHLSRLRSKIAKTIFT